MDTALPATDLLSRLRRAGLRPTRQRLALARMLFESGDRHVTAEQLHVEATAAAMRPDKKTDLIAPRRIARSVTRAVRALPR